MNTSMKAVIAALALGATIGSVGVATAGRKETFPVTVNLAARTASGALGDARRSADTRQLVTITIRGMANYSSGTAVFKDENGVKGQCFTTEPEIVAALQSVKSDGHVAVEWDADGQCIVVDNYTSSTRSVKEQ